MDELLLPVTYKGFELELPVNMYAYGYTYRIDVMVDNQVVIFEPDEEGSFRALGDIGKTDVMLLELIAYELSKLR